MIQFPKVKEVRLGKSPLSEVICQVRYPAILRIESEQPVAFQERVRKDFPQVEVERGLTIEGSPLQAEPPTTTSLPRIFRFKSADGTTIISLTTGFIAVSTTAYRHWKDFAQWVKFALEALDAIYEPTYTQRVGLRYINRITLENTGVTNVTELLGILRAPLTVILREPLWDQPPELVSQLLLPISEIVKLSLRCNFESGVHPTFVLDLDCFSEGRTPLKEVISMCHNFHDLIYRAFRWCIADKQLVLFAPIDPKKDL